MNEHEKRQLVNQFQDIILDMENLASELFQLGLDDKLICYVNNSQFHLKRLVVLFEQIAESEQSK